MCMCVFGIYVHNCSHVWPVHLYSVQYFNADRCFANKVKQTHYHILINIKIIKHIRVHTRVLMLYTCNFTQY